MPSNFDEKIDGGLFDDTLTPRNKEQRYKSKIATIESAKKIRKENKWDQRWSEFVQMYSNQYPYAELDDYSDIVVPNMIFSTVNVIVPSVSVSAPKITVTARRRQDEKAASVAEAVVNHQWREFQVQDQVREAVKDFVILGHGWLKVVWDFQTENQELDPVAWQEQVRAALTERQMAIENSTLNEDEFPSVEETVQSVSRTQDVVVADAPKVTRVSPFDIFVDPDALRLEDARWIAQRSFVPIQVARKNEDWNGGVRRKLKATVLSESRDGVDVMSGGGVDSKSKEAGFVVIYEFYDLVEKTVCTIAEGAKDYLSNPSKSPFTEVHPYVFLENFEVPERFYPVGDIETVYGLQLELALTRTALINDRKAGRRINLYRSGALGPEGVDALESGEEQVLLDVLEDRPFSDVFQSISPLGLDVQWYNQSEMIIGDINTITGVSEYARGTPTEIRRTATEAGLIQDAANARSADKLYKVERGMGQVASRMMRLSQTFMESEDVARVVSEDQVVDWVPYDRQLLQGEFVFEVEAGSTQPQNETFRRQAALQLMDVMAGFMGTGWVNEPKLIEHVLRNGFGIKNADEFIGQGPPPMPPEEGGPPLTQPPAF